MGTYTPKLYLSNPDSGACNWDTEWWRNQDIKDAVLAPVLNGDYVLNGCALSLGGGLDVIIAAGQVWINQTVFDVAGGTLPVTAADPDELLENYVYVNDSGAVVVSTTPPTGRYVLLGIADAETVSILRVSDLRNWQPSKDVVLVENAIINGTFDVWDYGTSSSAQTGILTANRFTQSVSGGYSRTSSRGSFAAGQTEVPNNPKYFLRNDITVAGSGNEYARLQYKVLGIDHVAGKKIAVSMWLKANAAKTIKITFLKEYSNGGTTPAEYFGGTNFDITTAWAQYTFFIDVPINAGVPGDLAYWGLLLNWSSSATAHQTGVFDIAELSAYESPDGIALPVRRPTLTETKEACLPYYYRITGVAESAFGDSQSGGSFRLFCPIGVAMIKDPTLSVSLMSHFRTIGDNGPFTPTGFSSGTVKGTGVSFTVTTTPSTVNFTPCNLVQHAGGSTGYIAFEAEI